MAWQSGDKIVLASDIFKASSLIRIHPSYTQAFPRVLPKGSFGEIVDYTPRDPFAIFTRFMLHEPGKYEHPFLKDNVVYLSFPIDQAFCFERSDWSF